MEGQLWVGERLFALLLDLQGRWSLEATVPEAGLQVVENSQEVKGSRLELNVWRGTPCAGGWGWGGPVFRSVMPV